MPRREPKFSAEVLATPHARVAAATRMTMRKGDDKRPKQDNNWQRVAWDWFDTIGEFRFAVAWVGNILSRALLYPTKDGIRTTDPDALAAMEALFGGPEGQREMLRQLGIQFTVAGEGYVVGEDGGDEAGDKWWVVASTEITESGGQWKIGNKEIENPLVIRLWRPHPRANSKPDAPTRAVLPILAEIDGLTKHVAAQIDSRLAGAGILLLPSGISFASASSTVEGEDGKQVTVSGDLDPFITELMETMMTAISNRADAAALVPILLQAEGEHLDKVRHVTFSTPLDEQSIELRKEAIRRLGLGMDMPPEILTGTGEINHWGAWQIEEASIKAHTEPLLHVITDSLTDGYLRPYLEGLEDWDEDEARRFSIAADTSKMRLRPNRSKEAVELYDRGVLSEEAMARENGFETGDMMNDQERTAFLTRKVAGGSTTPELVAQALRILGVNVTDPVDSIRVQEERPDRSLLEHPTQNPPDGDRTRESAAVAEVIVLRALERAGSRIKSKYRDRISMGSENVPAHTLYRFSGKLTDEDCDDLLVGAWSILAALPPQKFTAKDLDDYARLLLTTGRPHDSAAFAARLAAKDNG